jgi:hypothetical protein
MTYKKQYIILVLTIIFCLFLILLLLDIYNPKLNENKLKQIIYHTTSVKITGNIQIIEYSNDLQESGLGSLLHSDCYDIYFLKLNEIDYDRILVLARDKWSVRNEGYFYSLDEPCKIQGFYFSYHYYLDIKAGILRITIQQSLTNPIFYYK